MDEIFGTSPLKRKRHHDSWMTEQKKSHTGQGQDVERMGLLIMGFRPAGQLFGPIKVTAGCHDIVWVPVVESWLWQSLSIFLLSWLWQLVLLLGTTVSNANPRHGRPMFELIPLQHSRQHKTYEVANSNILTK